MLPSHPCVRFVFDMHSKRTIIKPMSNTKSIEAEFTAEFEQAADGRWNWKLVTSNGVAGHGQGFATREDAEKSAASNLRFHVEMTAMCRPRVAADDVCTVCLLVECTCEEALAERVAEESRRDEWAAEASQGERAQLAWGGGL